MTILLGIEKTQRVWTAFGITIESAGDGSHESNLKTVTYCFQSDSDCLGDDL